MIGIATALALATTGLAIALAPPPFRRAFTHKLNELMPNEILDALQSAELRRQGKLSESFYYSELKKAGLSRERADLLYWLTRKMHQIQDLVELRKRKEISQDEYLAKAKVIGVEVVRAEELLKIQKTLLDPPTVIRAMWRKIAFREGDKSYIEELKKQGYTDDRIKVIEQVSKFYPSPGDLIIWQAKEVYEPDAIEKFGLADELELLKKEPMYKAGLDDEQIRNYWIAHWEHPGWTAVREMLHRTDLNEEDVYEWFRLVEIPPFWRDKYTQVMYSPYTRVDVRRMHKLGVLDREGVKTAYQQLGYDEEKAENMTIFTELYNADSPEQEQTTEEKRKEELKGLTRSVIVTRFKDGMITEEETKEYLTGLGFTNEVTDFYISMADYERESERVDGLVKQYHKMFLNGIIDYNKTIDLLDELNIPDKHREYLMTIWSLERVGKPSQPSKAELIKFCKHNIIDLDTFKDKMMDLGYATIFIDWYIQEEGLIKVE